MNFAQKLHIVLIDGVGLSRTGVISVILLGLNHF